LFFTFDPQHMAEPFVIGIIQSDVAFPPAIEQGYINFWSIVRRDQKGKT